MEEKIVKFRRNFEWNSASSKYMLPAISYKNSVCV